MVAPEKLPDINQEDPEGIKPEKIRLATSEGLLVGGIWIELDDAPEGELPMRIVDGQLRMDKKRLEEEKETVKTALFDAILSGNEEIFGKITRSLDVAIDDKSLKLRKKLHTAFNKHKPQEKLRAMNVDLLTQGVAERNLIREGLKPQIQHQPFVFYDNHGILLDSQNDIDYIFVKGKGNTYKVIVGSKKGIASIELPNDLSVDSFQPDLTKIDKDPVTDAITIPLGNTKNGEKPLVSTMEIRKGPVDIIEKATREELRAQMEKMQEKREREYQQSYTPSRPSTPTRSSESGGYGYASSSG